MTTFDGVRARRRWLVALVVALLGCAPAPTAPDQELDRVAAIHGAPGPWAVAGYRMGRYALAKLDLPPGSFDLLPSVQAVLMRL